MHNVLDGCIYITWGSVRGLDPGIPEFFRPQMKLAYRTCLSGPSCSYLSILSCLCCPVSAALSVLSCRCFSCLFNSSRSLLVYLSWLSWLDYHFFYFLTILTLLLSYPCPVFPVLLVLFVVLSCSCLSWPYCSALNLSFFHFYPFCPALEYSVWTIIYYRFLWNNYSVLSTLSFFTSLSVLSCLVQI